MSDGKPGPPEIPKPRLRDPDEPPASRGRLHAGGVR